MKRKKTDEGNYLNEQRRLRKRKRTFQMRYLKNTVYAEYDTAQLIGQVLKDREVVVNVAEAGDIEDGTKYLTISIEGIPANIFDKLIFSAYKISD